MTPRGFTVATPVLAGCLVLAGCGSSSHSGTAKTSPAGSAKTSAASSPPRLAASLTRTMAREQPYFKNVKVSCPSTQVPVKCHFTATGGLPPIKKTTRVAGTISVTALVGGTYQYGLDYAPVR